MRAGRGGRAGRVRAGPGSYPPVPLTGEQRHENAWKTRQKHTASDALPPSRFPHRQASGHAERSYGSQGLVRFSDPDRMRLLPFSPLSPITLPVRAPVAALEQPPIGQATAGQQPRSETATTGRPRPDNRRKSSRRFSLSLRGLRTIRQLPPCLLHTHGYDSSCCADSTDPHCEDFQC